MDPSQGAIRSGRLVRGKWQIDARLGAGATATVYAATHKNNGLKVAIKVLKPDIARDPDMRARFLREGYVANAIQHPGVVRVLDDDTAEDGSVFLVMELLTGEMLETRVAREGGKLPLREVLSIIDKVLDVLAAAHTHGIVHRDIKPENIFLMSDGTLKILDFGLAQFKQGQDATKTGLILGTPDFMSPEQAAGNSGGVDARSDLYAVGAVMFTLLTGKPVHRARSLHEHLVLIASATAPSLASLDASLPKELVRIVDCALEVDKQRRWASAREMRDALREVVPPVSHPSANAMRSRMMDSEPPDAETVVVEAPPVSSQRTSGGPGPVSVRGPMDARPLPTDDELDETRLVPTGEMAAASQPVPPASHGTLHSHGQAAPAQAPHAPVSGQAPGWAPPPQVTPPSYAPPVHPRPPMISQPGVPGAQLAAPYDPARYSITDARGFGPPKPASPWPVRLLILALVFVCVLLLALVPLLQRSMAKKPAGGTAPTATTPAPDES